MKLNLTDILQKANSPKAYSTYAVIGVLATTALAIICTRKRDEEKTQTDISENQNEEMTREEAIEEIKEIVKDYAPVIASAAVTIFCIKKAESKWIAYNGLINAGYIATRDKLARYRLLAPAAAGAEIIKGFGDRGAPEEGVEWFCLYGFDDGPNVYFQSTKADVIEAEYSLNRNFVLRGSASAREFYAFLGILDQFPEEYGDYVGWLGDDMAEGGLDPWIDFEHGHVDTEDGIRIYTVGYLWGPESTDDMRVLAWGYQPTGTKVNKFNCGPTE